MLYEEITVRRHNKLNGFICSNVYITSMLVKKFFLLNPYMCIIVFVLDGKKVFKSLQV